jgi:hypothetical protein
MTTNHNNTSKSSASLVGAMDGEAAELVEGTVESHARLVMVIGV